jgi:hypothetical protein
LFLGRCARGAARPADLTWQPQESGRLRCVPVARANWIAGRRLRADVTHVAAVATRLIVSFRPQAVRAGSSMFDGYAFSSIDLPRNGSSAGAGTNFNGVANNGTIANYTRSPDGTIIIVPLTGNDMALGINSAGGCRGQSEWLSRVHRAGQLTGRAEFAWLRPAHSVSRIRQPSWVRRPLG